MDAAIVGIVDTVDVCASDAMQLARVIGDVVATRKDASLDGIDAAARPAARRRRRRTSAGRSSPSIRSAPASASTCSSCAARKPAFRSIPTEVPTDAGIVGIVDHWTVGASDDPGAGRRPGRLDA